MVVVEVGSGWRDWTTQECLVVLTIVVKNLLIGMSQCGDPVHTQRGYMFLGYRMRCQLLVLRIL